MENFRFIKKKYYSTETASVSAHNDILCALDKKEKGILLLLDLSAAFDSVDWSLHSSLTFGDWIWFWRESLSLVYVLSMQA